MNHQMSQLLKLNWHGSLITMSPCHISFLVLSLAPSFTIDKAYAIDRGLIK